MIRSQSSSKAPQPLTDWKVKDRYDQQARMASRHHSHSPTRVPRIGIISRLELQQGTTATHFLISQAQYDQQTRIAARHHSHSQTGESRTGMISRLEWQQGTTVTHSLESQGEA